MKLSQTRIAIVLADPVVSSSGCGSSQSHSRQEPAERGRPRLPRDAFRRGRAACPQRPRTGSRQQDCASFHCSHHSRSVSAWRQTPENIAKANEAIEAYKKILQTDPKNDEAYKAIAYFAGSNQAGSDKQRDWISQRATDPNADKDKRAEAYVVLASKDWDCSFKITDLPTNKITTVRPGHQ